VVETVPQGLGFEHGEIWQYDPLGVINNRRMELDITPYQHQGKPDLEKIRNMNSWEEVHNLLQGHIQKEVSMPSMQEVDILTPLP